MTALTFIVPGDPAQKTGGYLYDARIVAELRAHGHEVAVHGLAGRFPDVDAGARAALDDALRQEPDGRLVVIDGLALGALPDVAEKHARRLKLVALVHHPLADEWGLDAARARRFRADERRALAAVRHVVTTSRYTARHLQRDYGVAAGRLSTVEPGVEYTFHPLPLPPDVPRMPLRLLCVATLVPRKGHAVLVEALAQLKDLAWKCDCIGARRDAACAAAIEDVITQHGLQDRIHLRGEVSAAEVERAYVEADCFVLPSYFEGYGMVIAEALCHGLPVVTTTGGALADTLPAGAGIAVSPGDSGALANALRRVLGDPLSRTVMSVNARGAATRLSSWAEAGASLQAALTAAARPGDPSPQSNLLAHAATDTAARHDRPPFTQTAAHAPQHADPAADGAHFQNDWLALREPVDHRSRADALLAPLNAFLKTRAHPTARVVDLGAGSGSNLRYLAPRLTAPVRWRLIDHDPALLANIAMPGVQTAVRDLQAGALAGCIAGADLVTAAALLDLCSAEWVEAFVQACAAAHAAVLIALTIDGRVALQPPDAADPLVLTALARDERRDKGLGLALGPDAPALLVATLRAHGYRVIAHASDWQLGADDTHLTVELLHGWARAARQANPRLGEQCIAWEQRRMQSLSEGALAMTVGHQDMLTLPA